MSPDTGTLDHVACDNRIRSRRIPATRVRAWLPTSVLAFVVVLAGCVSQPQTPDAGGQPDSTANLPAAAPDDAESLAGDTAFEGPWPHRVAGSPAPDSVDPGEVVMLDGVPTVTPTGTGPREDASERPDAWARIRGGLSLPHPLHPRVERQIEWYRNNPEYLERLAQRARPYLAYIVRAVEKKKLPAEFALLPVVESAFKVYAYSRKGASGLWQFMPSTGRLYGLKQNWWYDGRRDVVASTHAALDYLTKLMRDFDGDRLLAVAAYNWGEGNVRRAMARNRARGKATDVWSLRLPRETRVHVSRLLAIAAVVGDPEGYGVVLESIPDRVQFEPVALDGQIDLSVAADLAGITLDEVYALNPGFSRGATDPRGPHLLQLPRGAVERFRTNLAQYSPQNRGHWIRHDIARGDTLGGIANRYRTTVAVLKEVNRLSSDLIPAGRHLMVPASAGNLDARQPARSMRARLGASGPLDPTNSTYRVRRGDSLSLIAHNHGMRTSQLAAWNGLSMNAVIHPGQRLTVHRRNNGSIPAAARKKDAGPSDDPAPAIIHVVKYGDTLSHIAQRHGTTALELAQFNRIKKSAILRPGQKLHVIPAAYAKAPAGRESIRYRVKRGDSLWEISRLFGVSVASLRKWNRLAKGELLMPGRELDVHVTPPSAI